jgi:single-strand DNA-binding protein
MNSITIAGQLGKDAELKQLQAGDAVCSFSVADSQGREKPTIWWNCQLWGKRAVSLTQYLTKGQSVTVSGNVTMREYTDKDGQPRKSMDIRVNDVALQGSKQDGQASAPRPAPAPRAAAPKASAGGSGFDDMDDNIPFLFNMNTVFDTMGTSKALKRIRNGKGMHMLQACSADC